MKRFGIFIFYDKYGAINEYVKYLLSQMSSLLTECCIVCNGDVTDESRSWLENNSNNVFFRENKGYDAGAYQDAILNRIGLTRLREFDELILFNNSFYGPIYSFEEMFQSMEQRKIDFWGITAHESSQTPYHIQSYFLVIEGRLLKSKTFEEYWRNQKECLTFRDAVKNFELKITNFFIRQGFTCGTYIDYLKTREEYDITGNLLNAANYELLAEKHCPIVKRKYIMQSMEYGLVQGVEDIIHFIQEKTAYDSGLIWADLIKEHSPYMLASYRNLNNYLTDPVSNIGYFTALEDVCIVIDSKRPEQFVNYTEKLSCKIVVFTYTDMGFAGYENITVIKKKGQLLDELLFVAGNLVQDVQYYCVLRDSVIVRGSIAEKRRNNNICRKLVISAHYIEQVKRLFVQQQYLGALFVEELFDDSYLSQRFCKQFLLEEQAELLRQNGCHAMAGEQLINHAGSFWVRADVLEEIEKRNIVCDHITEQELSDIFPYFVKAAGYYSGMLYNANVTAKEHMWEKVLLYELMDDVVFFDENHFKRQILEENILKFASRFQNIYIYGAGKYAKRLIVFLERKRVVIKKIILTSKAPELKFMGYPVSEIDEISLGENEGIIVAMSERNQKEVKEKLKMYPEESIYYV